MTGVFVRSILIACLWVLAPGVHADPRQVTWADLAAKASYLDNPFLALKIEQLERLAMISGLRQRKAIGGTLTAEDVAFEKKMVDSLREEGIDADKLLARRQEVAEKNRASARTVNDKLDGELVRLAGYLLPLEFSGKQVKEFLLVPWVGACIHTPPPPPNQIVHVVSDKPVDVQGLYAPVWVTGKMTAKASKRTAAFEDGNSEIEVGYGLNASQVEHVR